jgi:MFS family permease
MGLTTIDGIGKRVPATLLRLFLPFALAYLLSYVYRNVNAVITDDLVRATGVEAVGLGVLTSAYLAGFAVMQLPLGMLLDRFGPRRTQSVLLTVGALGAILFSFGNGLAGLAAGRFVIGVGVAGCLMASFKHNLTWWPKERLPFVNNMILVFGTVGAFAATTPFAALLHFVDWRGVFRLLALLTLAAAAYIALAVPAPPTRPAAGGLVEQLRGVRSIFTSRLFWRLAPLAFSIQATHVAYLSLWAGPWLRDVGGFDRAGVAQRLQLIPLAMMVGYAATGALATRLAGRGIATTKVLGVLAGLFLANEALLLVAPVAPAPQWMAFGFLATTGVLPYSILAQSFPPELGGRVSTALNLLVFGGAFLLQSLLGAIIDLFPATATGFDPAGHRAAMAAALTLCAAGFAWFLWEGRARRHPPAAMDDLRAGQSPARRHRP